MLNAIEAPFSTRSFSISSFPDKKFKPTTLPAARVTYRRSTRVVSLLGFPWGFNSEADKKKKKKEEEKKWKLIKYDWLLDNINNNANSNTMKNHRTTTTISKDNGEKKVIREYWEWVNDNSSNKKQLPNTPDTLYLDTESDPLIKKIVVEETVRSAVVFLLVFSVAVSSNELAEKFRNIALLIKFIQDVQKDWPK